MDEESPKISIGLSALTVVIILNLSVTILIAKNKRNGSAANVFIAAYALNEAICCFIGALRWSLKGIFKINVVNPFGCQVFFFITETSIALSFFFFLTIFVTITKLKQIRLRTVCVVIFVEVIVSAIYARPFIVYNDTDSSNGGSFCTKKYKYEGERTKTLIMRLGREASCLILAGIVLMTNCKQFKFGKSD
jgi:hypothetical protein